MGDRNKLPNIQTQPASRRTSVCSQSSGHTKAVAFHKDEERRDSSEQTLYPGRRSSRAGIGRPSITNISHAGMFGRRTSINRVFKGFPRQQSRRDSATSSILEEERIELPPTPRFLSLLSAEAQYAAMKCYEDILYERITDVFPEYQNVLSRTSSPPVSNSRLSIRPPPELETQTENEKQLAIEAVQKHRNNHNNMQLVPAMAITIQHQPGLGPRAVSELTSDKIPKLAKDSKLFKQLIMSYRFQNAMDILDTIRKKDGQTVTSARVHTLRIDPIHNFNLWNNNMSREFEFARI
ncbi:uncharacterized protein LOC141905805 [Tubulanus polymorphus]|uniref:uncharacterized protein LOC141905805 n=1 Tax=Tubulanus polymorphus TaxID=672921 RepID=UPI003DA33D93